jgi:zinc D-Ala-D-Ala dipeptidase
MAMVFGATDSSGRAAEQLRAHLMEGCRLAAAGGVVVPIGLVDLRKTAPSLVTLEAPAWSDPELRFLVRPEVAERLERAASVLPSDVRLGFWEGLRPVSVQRRLWRQGMDYLIGLYPERCRQDLEIELEQYVAHPEGKAPPHSTGSAVDVAPLDAFGRILGPADAWGRLAVETMRRALAESGLANYQPEWWHWSYGDEEWARAYDCAPLSFAEAPVFDGPGGGI